MPGIYLFEKDGSFVKGRRGGRLIPGTGNTGGIGGNITASVGGILTLYGWGDNTYAQVGDTGNIFKEIGSDTNWTKVTSNNIKNYSIKTDGTLWGWGENNFAELATGDSASKYVPTQIGSDTNWVDVSIGVSTLALKSNGTLWGWGFNSSGELGLGDTIRRTSPTQVGSDTNWSKIYTGQFYSLAIKSNGTLWAAGYNASGQLGIGNTTNTSNFTQVGSDTDWVHATAGYYASAGIKSNGTLWVWGSSAYGALGRGTTSDNSNVPVQLGTDTDWKWISTGQDFMVAIKTDGTLWSWGRNLTGELGLGSTGVYDDAYLVKDVNTPTQVGSDTWAYVYASTQVLSAVIGIQTDGTLWGWGTMLAYRLGYDYNIWYISPFDDWISSPNKVEGITNVVSASIGGQNTLFIKSNGTLYEGGEIPPSYSYYGELTENYVSSSGTPVLANTNYQLLTGSSILTSNVTVKPNGTDTFILSDNVLLGWGYNDYGQLGTGDSASRSTPVIVSTNVSKIATGNYYKPFTTIIKTDGTLWTAGENGSGQLGLGDYDNRTTFTQIGTDSNWIDVSTNDTLALAIKSDGTLWAWGEDVYGGFGTSSIYYSETPVQIGTGSNWQKIFTGYRCAFAIQSDNTLWAWGNNVYGQLGIGNTSAQYDPVQVGSDTDWYHVSNAGATFTVAQKTDGTLWAWGLNDNGQLGIGNTTNQLSPVSTGNGNVYVLGKVEVTDSVVLAIKVNAGSYQNTGTLWGWGYNAAGTLGLTFDNRTAILSPIQIGTNIDWFNIGIGSLSVVGSRYII